MPNFPLQLWSQHDEFLLLNTIYTHVPQWKILIFKNLLQIEINDDIIKELIFSQTCIILGVDWDPALGRWRRIYHNSEIKKRIQLSKLILNSKSRHLKKSQLLIWVVHKKPSIAVKFFNRSMSGRFIWRNTVFTSYQMTG